MWKWAGVAQLAEHKLPKLGVAGSNPVARSKTSLVFLVGIVVFKPDCTGFLKVGSARFFLWCGMDVENEQNAARGITAKIEEYASALLADLGMELVEMQFRREGQGWVLRLFIDKEGGVTIDDCAAVSREISAYLEVEDCIDHAYSLEVSSPGLERPLKTEHDFLRFAGRRARIKIRESGEMQSTGKVLVGTLVGMEGGRIALLVEKDTIQIDKDQIIRARLTLD